MRLLLATTCLLVFAGCSWLTPPCTRAAKPVCEVGSEGDACAFLLGIDRSDSHAQDVCKQLLPTAEALAKDPRSMSAQADWRVARASLTGLGLVTDPTKGRIENKLKQADGLAGKLVKQAEINSAMGEQKTAEGAEKAFDAINK